MKKTRLILSLCILLVLLSALCCAACGSTESAPAAAPTVESTAEPTTEPEAVAANQQDGAEIPFEESECYSVIKTTLETAFDFLKPEISYDAENRLMHMVFTAPDGTDNAMILDKKAIEKDWNDLCENLNGVGKTAYEACLSKGYQVGCAVMVLSDSNPENALFASLNGETVYNAIDDSEE